MPVPVDAVYIVYYDGDKSRVAEAIVKAINEFMKYSEEEAIKPDELLSGKAVTVGRWAVLLRDDAVYVFFDPTDWKSLNYGYELASKIADAIEKI